MLICNIVNLNCIQNKYHCWKANETYPFWVHSTLEDKCIYFFYNAFAIVENLKWN